MCLIYMDSSSLEEFSIYPACKNLKQTKSKLTSLFITYSGTVQQTNLTNKQIFIVLVLSKTRDKHMREEVNKK